jgi:hypothetical protein
MVIFWDICGFLLVDYQPKALKINSEQDTGTVGVSHSDVSDTQSALTTAAPTSIGQCAA